MTIGAKAAIAGAGMKDATGAGSGVARTFDTGATRDSEAGKPDYEGFLCPLVIARYGEYMSEHRVQSDGELRDSDNWQKGIPMSAYMKSGWRHFFDWWRTHRAVTRRDDVLEGALCALMFNVMGYLHEHLKQKGTRVAAGPKVLVGTPVPSKTIQARIYENGKWREVE